MAENALNTNENRTLEDKMKADFLMDNEMEHVLAALTPENRLVMRLCCHTGLRVGDALKITTDQVQKRRFSVTEAKTGKRKTVTLPDSLLADLQEQGRGHLYVFPHRCDPLKHRTRQAVWSDVKRAAKAFRLPVNATPHSARKMYAVELLERYGDIDRVREALNHSSVEVTMVYAMADKLRRERNMRRRRK